MKTLQVNTTLKLDDIIINPEYEEIIPPLTDDEFERLKNSIAEVGLYEPIVINTERVILDGHHRFKACKEAGVLPRFTIKSFDTKIAEEIYVIETNVIRRQLNQYQATILGLKLEDKYSIQAKERQGTRTDLTSVSFGTEVDFTRTDEKAANAVGLKRSTFTRAKYVLNNGTITQLELFKKGKKKAGSLYKEIKRKEKIEELRAEIPELVEPQGDYEVIVVDPPWPYGTEYDADAGRRASPYPELDLEKIKAIELPASENCVLWLWTTNRFLHDAFHVLEAWGFEPKTVLTWVKDRMGLGTWLRGQTEHCILAIKGTPIVNLTNQTTALHAFNKGHSTKPDEFYELIDEYCIGNKLEWFSRTPRENWSTFGTMEGSY